MASASIEMEMAELRRMRAHLDLLRQEMERADVLVKEAVQRMVPLLTEPPRYLAIIRKEHFDAFLALHFDSLNYGIEDVDFTEPKLLFNSSLAIEEEFNKLLRCIEYDCLVAKGVVEATPTLEAFTQAYGHNLSATQSFFDVEYKYLIAAGEFGKRRANENTMVNEAANLRFCVIRVGLVILSIFLMG